MVAAVLPTMALDNVPLLFYILALKTLVLCLGFAGVKIYQAKKEEAKLKIQRAEQRRIAEQVQELLDNELLDNKKDD
ncbi:small integral membrane protein 11-like isoform X1 [Oncorhynchus nerka]|uniref:small integral membrane protein 11-like isoform X1 n=1 Tax=Oncorhynchus nerka TaxID=8023 RepID=UPI0031B820E4